MKDSKKKLTALWFKHDLSASEDPKLLRIKRKTGYEGIGIYWSLVEMLYKNEGQLTLEELEDFCFDKNCPVDKAKLVCQIGFIIDSQGIITNPRITKELAMQEEKSTKAKESAKKRWSPRVVEEPEWMKEEYKEPKETETKMSDEEFHELKKRVFGEDD